VPMRTSFTLLIAAVAAYAIYAAQAWPTKAALFPLVMAIPLVALALVQLVLDLRAAPAASQPVDRRVGVTFGWMGAFMALVLLIGFPLAVPVWLLAHLVIDGAVGWLRGLLLAGGGWAVFHGLFERVLRFPFEAGLVQTWLGY
jgi:hypothetical protein